MVSAIAISEPGAGGDPAAMRSRAVREGDHWVLNGRKIWISRAAKADFTIVMAATDREKGARGGISAFIVDKGTPGFNVLRRIPMLGGHFTYEIALEDLRLPHTAMLGEEGKGFAPMQERLSNRRVQMAAWCTGRAQRALDMMVEYAPQRSTFGVPLSERQAIQWWIADAATRIHACRLMTHEAAWRIDTGRDARSQVSMIKAYATEMAWEIIDRAMQTFGAMGMTKELPLQQMANDVRLMRVYEGPTEVHRWVVARNTLAGRG
jgi:acyl-CoA dehydrogenase